MTEGVYKGSELRIYIDDEVVFHATSCALDITRGTKERATKDTDGTEVSLDKYTWSANGDGLAVANLEAGVTAAKNFENLFDLMIAGTQVVCKFSLGPVGNNGIAGDVFYQGNAFLSNLNASAAVDEDATSSYTLTGNGSIAKQVLS